MSFGNGGWVRVDNDPDDDRLPGRLYVRLEKDDASRWRVAELYLEADQWITGSDVRKLPIAAIEAYANVPGATKRLDERSRLPSIQLGIAASYFASTGRTGPDIPGRSPRTWVDDMLDSQLPDSGVPKPRRVREPRPRGAEPLPRLRAPEGRLTDDFLRQVHQVYAAAVARGEHPAPVLAAQTGASVHAARKWIRTARQRGIMPAGRQGRVG